MFANIKNKRAFIGVVFVLVVSCAMAIIEFLDCLEKIGISRTPNASLLSALMLSLFIMSYGYDGGKHKKWFICIQVFVVILYLIDVVGWFVYFGEGFMPVWKYIKWWGATSLSLLSVLCIIKKKTDVPAQNKLTDEAEPANNAPTPDE